MRRRAWLQWSLGLAALAGVAVALYWFAPDETRFYPRCWFHELTGYQCPGCGGLRAGHQLLHGHLGSALRYNPLLVLLLPWLAAWGIGEAVRWMGGRDWVASFRRPLVVWTLAVAVIAFGVLRNVPFQRWLGPIL